MKVKIKTFEQMEKQFGLDSDGNINGLHFWEDMEKVMPKDRIVSVERGMGALLWHYSENRSFLLHDSMIESYLDEQSEMKEKMQRTFLDSKGNVWAIYSISDQELQPSIGDEVVMADYIDTLISHAENEGLLGKYKGKFIEGFEADGWRGRYDYCAKKLVINEKSEAVNRILSTADKIMEERIDKTKAILFEKAKQYGRKGRFGNFDDIAELMEMSPEQALMTLVSKHIVALKDYVLSPDGVPMEQWEEKIGDIICYMCLLEAMVKTKAGE